MARLKIGALLRAAAVAGPVILKIITSYGPQLKRLYDRNPEAFARVMGTVKSFGGKAGGGLKASGVRGIEKRIAEIREQVVYLRDSADDAYERDRAVLWNAQLDRLESAAGLVSSMGAEARAKEVERLNERLDRLAADVLAAFIDEVDEDSRKAGK